MEQVNCINELEKLILKWKNGETAIYDMVAVLEYIDISTKYDIYADELIVNTLMEKLINELEESKITIPLKGKNIREIFDFPWEQKQKIIDRYKDKMELNELNDKFNFTYREYSARRYNGFASKENVKFDFVGSLLSSYPCWITELLISDINKNLKNEIIYNLIEHCIENQLYNEVSYILSSESNTPLSRTSIDNIQIELKKVIKDFNSSNYNNTLLLNKILKSKMYNLIGELQNIGLVNFDTILIEPGKEMALCAYICSKSGSLDDFKTLYQSQDYINKSEKTLNETEHYIYETININEIAKFIEISHLPLTKQIIELIATRVLKYQIEDRQTAPRLIIKIKNAIENKCNRENLLDEYSQMFENLSDYNNHLSRKNNDIQEQISQKTKKLLTQLKTK